MAAPFDVLEHHRRRTRTAEARADTLEALNAQYVRLLAHLLQDRFDGTDVDPLEYMQACVDIDMSAQRLRA